MVYRDWRGNFRTYTTDADHLLKEKKKESMAAFGRSTLASSVIMAVI